MKISLKWVSDFVEIKDYFSKPEELAEILTQAGLEVEEIINRAKDFQNVVVGHILEKGKHPNADKLSLCRVSTGEGIVHQIVCGAQNHKTNDRVIVALPGAVLPGNFAIKKSAIRGVESLGMLCSLKELGLAKESEGIAILPENAPVGKPYAEYAGYDDIVFELKVTPNRADCLSHFGLAREIACLLKREIKKPEIKFSTGKVSTKAKLKLDVKATDLCPRYVGRFISGVKVGPSPLWLKQRLENVGLNSINNVVDITNYVMMEMGQPLHAFDYENIQGATILVDKAKPEENFITLDGTNILLNGEELMIRDGTRPVAMAGVVGGKNSGVSIDTKDIFLESAYFLPMVVRKSSRGHGIETDSAYRFSRGVDPEGTMSASDRATQLIVEHCGGVVAEDYYDIYPQPIKKNFIMMNIQTVSERLGYMADETKFVDFMKRMGCQVDDLQNGHFRILPPTYRFDLEMDMDLVEEYARLNGYEHIPESLPSFHSEPTFHDKNYLLTQKVSEVFRTEGYQQAFNFAFVSKKQQEGLLGSSGDEILLLNPLNEDLNVMRKSLFLGLFNNLKANYHYGNSSGRLFEIGNTFKKKDSNYDETIKLGCVLWGSSANLWNKKQSENLIFELKASVEKLLKHFVISAYTWKQEIKNTPHFAHQGQYAELIVEGKTVGFISSLHPNILDENKIRTQCVMAEIDLSVLFATQPRPYRIQSISRYPAIVRDLALVMPKNLAVVTVMSAMKKQGGALLSQIEVFDVYSGEGLDPQNRSVAFSLKYQDKNATLQDTQVTEVQNKILDHLKKEFNISVR